MTILYAIDYLKAMKSSWCCSPVDNDCEHCRLISLLESLHSKALVTQAGRHPELPLLEEMESTMAGLGDAYPDLPNASPMFAKTHMLIQHAQRMEAFVEEITNFKLG